MVHDEQTTLSMLESSYWDDDETHKQENPAVGEDKRRTLLGGYHPVKDQDEQQRGLVGSVVLLRVCSRTGWADWYRCRTGAR